MWFLSPDGIRQRLEFGRRGLRAPVIANAQSSTAAGFVLPCLLSLRLVSRWLSFTPSGVQDITLVAGLSYGVWRMVGWWKRLSSS